MVDLASEDLAEADNPRHLKLKLSSYLVANPRKQQGHPILSPKDVNPANARANPNHPFSLKLSTKPNLILQCTSHIM